MKKYLREVLECFVLVMIALLTLGPVMGILLLSGYGMNDKMDLTAFIIIIITLVMWAPLLLRTIFYLEDKWGK